MTLKRRVFVLLSCVLLACPVGVLSARQIPEWPYDKLFKHAELVVIVRPISVREAKAGEAADPPASYLTGVVTNFRVLHVVKGQYADKNLDLVHFRINPKFDGVIGNGPSLVAFHTQEIAISGKSWSGGTGYPEYMVFLKKQQDGRFTFVSGQFDPELSVKQLLKPLP